jgi:hypothetical protein
LQINAPAFELDTFILQQTALLTIGNGRRRK